jgi:hypothetical protein
LEKSDVARIAEDELSFDAADVLIDAGILVLLENLS